jgi:predicted membrane protein
VCGGNFEFNWNGGRRNALSLALLVLAVGVQLLLSRILCRDMSFWNILWPTTLIVYGSVALTKRFSFLPLGCSLFGLYYLLIYWKLVPFFEDVKLLFPVALVIFGVSLFAGALRKPKKPQFRFSHDGSKRKSACSTDNGYLDFSASFGDNDQYISMTQLNGGQISTSFGDYAIDLSGVQALREGCTLDVNCSFGALLLLVPRRFAVKHSSATSFGEFEICGHPEEAPQGTLYLKTSVSFGEITVRYV